MVAAVEPDADLAHVHVVSALERLEVAQRRQPNARLADRVLLAAVLTVRLDV